MHSPLLLLPALFVHRAAFSVGSDQEVFISVTNKKKKKKKTTEKKPEGRPGRRGKKRERSQSLLD